MKLKFKILFVFAFVSATLVAQSSIEDQVRIEIQNGELDNFFTLPKKKLVAYGTSLDASKDPQLLIKIYNSKLEEIESQEIKIGLRKGTGYTKLSKDSTELYFIYVSRSEMQTIAYNFETKEIENHTVDLDGNGKNIAKLFSLTTAGNKLFLLGQLKNGPCLMAVDMHHGTTSLIVPPGVTKKSTMRIISDDENPNVTLGYYTEKIKKATHYNVVQISPEGEVSSDVIHIPMEENKTLLSAAYSKGKNDDFYMVGGYSKNLTLANGMYFIHGKGSEIMETKYLDFDQVEDFYSYLGTKAQERIEKKKSKNKYDTKTKITVHNIEVLNNHYVIVGEVYYATYRQVAHTTYVNGRATTTYTSVFDGYQYTHAVIMELDESFDLVHSATFTLFPGYKPYTCLLYTSPSPRDTERSRMPSSA